MTPRNTQYLDNHAVIKESKNMILDLTYLFDIQRNTQIQV